MSDSLNEEERKLCIRLGTSDRFLMILAGTIFVIHKTTNANKVKIEMDFGEFHIKLISEETK